jgi:hypothetical protein
MVPARPTGEFNVLVDFRTKKLRGWFEDSKTGQRALASIFHQALTGVPAYT